MSKQRNATAKKERNKKIANQPLPVRMGTYRWREYEEHPIIYHLIIHALQSSKKSANVLINRRVIPLNLISIIKKEIKRLKAKDEFTCCNTTLSVKEFKLGKNKINIIECEICKEFVGVKKKELF